MSDYTSALTDIEIEKELTLSGLTEVNAIADDDYLRILDSSDASAVKTRKIKFSKIKQAINYVETGLVIKGYYASLQALQAAVTAPAPGDAYGVNTATANVYDVYIWDGVGKQWLNNGHLKGENATVNGVAALTIQVGDGLSGNMSGSTYTMSLDLDNYDGGSF